MGCSFNIRCKRCVTILHDNQGKESRLRKLFLSSETKRPCTLQAPSDFSYLHIRSTQDQQCWTRQVSLCSAGPPEYFSGHAGEWGSRSSCLQNRNALSVRRLWNLPYLYEGISRRTESVKQTSMETLNVQQCYAQTNRVRAHALSARDALCFLFPPLPCFFEFRSFNSAGSTSFSSAVIVCSFLPVSCLFPCSLYW